MQMILAQSSEWRLGYAGCTCEEAVDQGMRDQICGIFTTYSYDAGVRNGTVHKQLHIFLFPNLSEVIFYPFGHTSKSYCAAMVYLRVR